MISLAHTHAHAHTQIHNTDTHMHKCIHTDTRTFAVDMPILVSDGGRVKPLVAALALAAETQLVPDLASTYGLLSKVDGLITPSTCIFSTSTTS